MFGLINKLILRPSATGSEDSLLSRRVIIPQGEICFRKEGDFTSVSVDIGAEQHVRWHEYTIDPILGCLTSNGSLNNKLYQCYLHALTSHCLPDPLLGHTGTEEALYILQSASCRSFQRLDDHEAKLLESIGNLTPNRDYSRHLQSMVRWKDLPALSQHHSFFPVACSIFDHARALEVLYDPRTSFDADKFNRNQSLLNRAASRNRTYYPADIQISEQPSSPDDVTYRSRHVSDLGTAEHVAFQTSWSILNDRPYLDGRSADLWNLMNSWGSLGPPVSEVSLRYSRYWLKFDAARDWFAIYDLCRRAGHWDGGNSKIKLSFSFSAAAYEKSKYYENIVPFLVIIALNETCHNLDPPQERSYMLLHGLAPTSRCLQDLVAKSSLPMRHTPVRFLELTTYKKKAEYTASIGRESSAVAESILRQWPDYESVDIPNLWFDTFGCKSSIGKYKQSIFWNNRLKDHVLQLQNILEQYVHEPMPAAQPYKYSPQFMTSSKAPSYSIRNVLMTRAGIPSLPENGEPFDDSITSSPPTEATECITPRVGSDSLEILVEELRNSQQPLQKLYGDDLSKSLCELLRQDTLQSAQGAIPSHALLLTYHDSCIRGKDNVFSEISTALAPSQNVEKIHGVAGLWPRITPRSLLRQLARDRIGKLPDQWRSVIMRYATSLLKYRHSVRLLELSSGQRSEELLRELEAIRNDVLAESTPDWLLIQVRPIFFS
jgi:hypothetical protein